MSRLHPRRLASSLTLATAGALGLLFLAPADGAAQVSTTRGWSFALYLQGAALSVEGGDAGGGGGGGLRIGYGLNRTVTLFLRGDASQTDVDDASIEGQWDLTHGEFGARFRNGALRIGELAVEPVIASFVCPEIDGDAGR